MFNLFLNKEIEVVSACTPEYSKRWGKKWPSNWNFKKGSHWGKRKIIAWNIMEDDRSLYVESIITVLQVNKAWSLNYLYRHPFEKDLDQRVWQLAVIIDGKNLPLKQYNHKPTQLELIQFFNGCEWIWQGLKNNKKWEIHSCGINLTCWKEMTGDYPPKKLLNQMPKF